MLALIIALALVFGACASEYGSVPWWLCIIGFVLNLVISGNMKDWKEAAEEWESRQEIDHKPLDLVNDEDDDT